MKARRIQRKRTKGFKLPKGAICCSRPSEYSNPFPLSQHGLERSLQLYRRYLQIKLQQNPDYLEPLRGKLLACWCPLTSPCHVDCILEELNRASRTADHHKKNRRRAMDGSPSTPMPARRGNDRLHR